MSKHKTQFKYWNKREIVRQSGKNKTIMLVCVANCVLINYMALSFNDKLALAKKVSHSSSENGIVALLVGEH